MTFTNYEYADMAVKANAAGQLLNVNANGKLVLLDPVLPGKSHEDIWFLIKVLRTEKLAAGIPVEYHGQTIWFDSDEKSRIQQQALFGLAISQTLPEALQWKTLANDFTTMTPELAVALAAATVRHDDAIFTIAEQHRQAMLGLDDPTDYDFSTGWPQSYQDVLDAASKAEAFARQSEGEADNTVVEQPSLPQSHAEDNEIDAMKTDIAEIKAQFTEMTGLLRQLAGK